MENQGENTSLEQTFNRMQNSFKSYLRSEMKYLNLLIQYSIGRIVIVSVSLIFLLSILLTLGLTLSFYVFVPESGVHEGFQTALLYYSGTLVLLLVAALVAAWVCSRQIMRVLAKYFEHWSE